MRLPGVLIYCSYQIHIVNEVRRATFHFQAITFQIRWGTLAREMTKVTKQRNALYLQMRSRFHFTCITNAALVNAAGSCKGKTWSHWFIPDTDTSIFR